MKMVKFYNPPVNIPRAAPCIAVNGLFFALPQNNLPEVGNRCLAVLCPNESIPDKLEFEYDNKQYCLIRAQSHNYLLLCLRHKKLENR